MITQFYLYTLANNNLKRNLKKQFPFNSASINKILCHGCDKDDRLAHWKSYTMPTDVLDTRTHTPQRRKDLGWQYHRTHLQSEMKIQCALQKAERLLLDHERCQDSWPPEEKNSIQGQQ